jgi:hypothetical protein
VWQHIDPASIAPGVVDEDESWLAKAGELD